jgi:hypothetical protein
MDEQIIQGAADEAAKLVKETLTALTQSHSAINTVDDPKDTRLFFPHGIELIYFKLNFGKDIDVTIAIGGEKAKYPGAGVAGAETLVVTNKSSSDD